MVAAAGIAGGTGAWFLQPAIAPDARISAAARRASDADLAAKAQKERADSLEKSLDATALAKRDAEAKLALAETAQSELAGRVSAEAKDRKAVESVQTQLRSALDKLADAVTVEGREVHVRFAERAMFKPGDDALSDRGKQALTRLAAALRELPDQQVWVQGHTDELPAAPPAPPARPVAAKSGKPGKAAAAVPAPPAPRFATSWELSAARALAAVHFLQDVAKLEPTRLSAGAFGPYAPLPRKDRSMLRRLEIVVSARLPRT